ARPGRAGRCGADGLRRAPGARGARRDCCRSREPLSPMRLGLALGALALIVVLWATGAGAAMTAEPIAVMQGLDKITARISRFDLPVGKPVMFFTLSVVVRDCERSAPEDRPENAAFVEIYENRPG